MLGNSVRLEDTKIICGNSGESETNCFLGDKERLYLMVIVIDNFYLYTTAYSIIE